MLPLGSTFLGFSLCVLLVTVLLYQCVPPCAGGAGSGAADASRFRVHQGRLLPRHLPHAPPRHGVPLRQQELQEVSRRVMVGCRGDSFLSSLAGGYYWRCTGNGSYKRRAGCVCFTRGSLCAVGASFDAFIRNSPLLCSSRFWRRLQPLPFQLSSLI